MCYSCYEEAGKPVKINEEVKKAVDMICILYDYPCCSSGGYAHIVTDDYNLEDTHIDFCIAEAKKGNYEFIDEQGRKLCLKVLNQMKKLSKEERYTALALFDGFIK